MSTKYIAIEPRGRTQTPRCDLPGSPFGSSKQAKQAAQRAGIEQPVITTVRRQA